MIRNAALVALLATTACSSQHLAPKLVAAAQPSNLPLVLACWEKEFERADFSGGYVAQVDFIVEAGTSKIKGAHVVTIAPAEKGGAAPPATLTTCLESALDRSVLPTASTPDVPGFVSDSDVTVRGYRFAFSDSSSERRSRASRRQANILLGPRADRCQGLYSHEPPRDASTLYAAVSDAEARAAVARSTGERDTLARELSKAYDAELELRARLASDKDDPMLPEANRVRMEEALAEVEASARKTAAKIGCALPAR